MRTIMAASGESLWGRSCLQTAGRISGRSRGATGVPWRYMLVPMYRRALEGCISRAPASACWRWSRVSVLHVLPRWRATSAGVGESRGCGSDVDPCWILRSGTSTRRIP